MSTMLCLDASGPEVCVALVRDGKVVREDRRPAGRGRGGGLFVLVRDALALAPDLDSIRVGIGPGSYAGCRQAIAAAQGIALGRGAHLAGYCSHLAMAVGVPGYAVVADARRGTVYASVIHSGMVTLGPEILPVESMAAWREGHRLPVFRETSEPEWLEAEPVRIEPARFAFAVEPGKVEGLEPLYLRPPTITQPKRPHALLD